LPKLPPVPVAGEEDKPNNEILKGREDY